MKTQTVLAITCTAINTANSTFTQRCRIMPPFEVMLHH